MWFYRNILRVPWTEHVSNNEVLKKIETKRKLIFNTEKSQLKFLGYIIRKESLENLILTGQIDDKRYRRKQRITYLP